MKLCTAYIGKRLDDVYIPVETGAFHVTFTWNSLRALFFWLNHVHEEICPSFGFLKSSGCEILSSEKIKVMLENVKYLDEDAFDTDSNLLN